MRSRTSSGFCTFATAVKHTVETGSLVAEFFGPGFQTRDAVPLVSPFVCFYALIHVRLAPPEQAVDKGGQFPSGGKYSHISSNQSRGLAIVCPQSRLAMAQRCGPPSAAVRSSVESAAAGHSAVRQRVCSREPRGSSQNSAADKIGEAGQRGPNGSAVVQYPAST